MNIYECYFKGIIDRNPGGNMGVGAIIYKNRIIVDQFSDYHPAKEENTCNVVELKAYLWIVETLLKEDLKNSVINICGGSKIVINNVKKKKRTTSNTGYFTTCAEKAFSLTKQIKGQCKVYIKYVPKEQNKIATELSIKALKKYSLNNSAEQDCIQSNSPINKLELLKKHYPTNNFFQSLWQQRKHLTLKQIECINKDYALRIT